MTDDYFQTLINRTNRLLKQNGRVNNPSMSSIKSFNPFVNNLEKTNRSKDDKFIENKNLNKLEDAVFDLIVNNHEKFEIKEEMRLNENYKRIQTIKRRKKINDFQENYGNIRSSLDIIDKIMQVNPRATLLQTGIVPLEFQPKVI